MSRVMWKSYRRVRRISPWWLVMASVAAGCTDPAFGRDAAVEAGVQASDGADDAGSDGPGSIDAQLPEAGTWCGTPEAPKTLGDDCPDDVACGNASTCDLTRNICCIDFLGADFCTARTSCTGESKQARCDGAEDCGTGQVCCFSAGYTACAADCPEDFLQLCHTDADCEPGVRCVAGRDEGIPLRLYLYWGFCGNNK